MLELFYIHYHSRNLSSYQTILSEVLYLNIITNHFTLNLSFNYYNLLLYKPNLTNHYMII